VNFGADLDLDRAAEPLLAPPNEPGHGCWRIAFSSEDPRYGGYGCAEPDSAERGWLIFSTHDVSDSPTPYGCTPEMFTRVLDWSLASGAIVLPVAEACDAIFRTESKNVS